MDNQPSTPPNPIEGQRPKASSNYAHPADQTGPSNIFAIIGFVLAFVIPFFGLVVSIVGLVEAKNYRNKGKGLAIAGIIISCLWFVVIFGSVLALLILGTFTGIRQKANDAERRADINTISNQLENYYTQNNIYPSRDELFNSGWRSKHLPTLDDQALKDPVKKFDSDPLYLPETSAKYYYSYAPTSIDGGPCDNSLEQDIPKGPPHADCHLYKLTATLDTGGTYTKSNKPPIFFDNLPTQTN